jgi:hypothetical protein
MPAQRRFPPPWKAEKIAGGYVVRDGNDQAIAYTYSRATETDALQAKVLTDDEARRVAINIARLPELLGHAVDDEVRSIVERNWPHLHSKLPPKDE